MSKEKSIAGQAEDWRHADASAAGRHGRYPIQDGALPAPSPRLPSGRLRPSATGYGEGRGEEGPFHMVGLAETPLTLPRGPVIGPAKGRTRWLGRPLPASGERYRRRYVSFTGTRSNSLFRRTNSLFEQKRFPVPLKQGIAPQHTGIAARMDLGNRRIGRKFAKFPVIFPASRECGDQDGSDLHPTLDVI